MGLHEAVGLNKWESLSRYVASLSRQEEAEAQEPAAGGPKKRGRPPKRKQLAEGNLIFHLSLSLISSLSSFHFPPSLPLAQAETLRNYQSDRHLTKNKSIIK